MYVCMYMSIKEHKLDEGFLKLQVTGRYPPGGVHPRTAGVCFADAFVHMGGGIGGKVWGHNVPPHFWDQRGTGGTGGRSNENDLSFYTGQSSFSTVQVTELQLP